MRSTGGIIVVAFALFGAAAGLAGVREARYPASPLASDALYLTSGATAQRLTAGYNALAADLYWIRAIQHYGGEKLKLTDTATAGGAGRAAAPYPLLYPLLDLTTSLDPSFNIAYRFGSIFLAEAVPAGPGRPDLAITLLEKGLAHRPDKWEYMQDIGFVHYWWRHDYPAAAAWFTRASEVAGAPIFLRSLAATTLATGGDRQSSRLMWESIYQSAEVDWLRRDAERRLLQFEAMDAIDKLQAAIDRAAQLIPGLEPTWESLIRARVLRAIPVDPSGAPYAIDAAGRITVASTSPLFPLTTEPPRGPGRPS